MKRSKQSSPLEIMDNVLQFRETLRGMVAGLVQDGFTDVQARRIVARIVSGAPESIEEAAHQEDQEPPW